MDGCGDRSFGRHDSHLRVCIHNLNKLIGYYYYDYYYIIIIIIIIIYIIIIIIQVLAEFHWRHSSRLKSASNSPVIITTNHNILPSVHLLTL